MSRWTIPLFKVRGIQLAVHASFVLFLAYFACVGWSDGGWRTAFWTVADVLTAFACITLHELGHCYAAFRFGIGTRRILLTPVGGVAELNGIPRRPREELIMALAGPAVNFVLAALLVLVVGVPAGWPLGDVEYADGLRGFGQFMLTWNLVMGTFNLLPAFPMDGGRVLRAGLATFLGYGDATFVAATVGKVICLAGIGLALVLPHPYLSGYLPVVLFAFIFISGNAELRAVRRQELARRFPDAPPPLLGRVELKPGGIIN